MSLDLGTWVAALLTLAVLTFLYKENPIWRFAEHLYIGLQTAYLVGYTWQSFLRPAFVKDMAQQGHWSYLIPVVLGLLIYTRYFPGISWIARYPIAIWVGYGAGYVLAYTPHTLVGQIAKSFFALNSINNLLIVVALLSGLIYFFFTLKQENPVVAGGALVGRYAIMIALGASFSATVLYRYSLLYGRVFFLLHNWLGIA